MPDMACLHVSDCLVKHQNNTGLVLGFPLTLEAKTLLLKVLFILAAGHRKINLELVFIVL